MCLMITVDEHITDSWIRIHFPCQTMTCTLTVNQENLQREEADMEWGGSQMTLISYLNDISH